MNIFILLLASFTLFAASFETKLRDLNHCLDTQKTILSNLNKQSRLRSRQASDRLAEVREKYENQFTITQVVGFLASTVSFDACAEDPESSRTVVGKLKGYQRQSSDLWEIDNKIYDWKFLSVKAKFDISDYLYGRRSDKEKLVRDLKTATRKSDQASLAVNAIAKKYGQSYKVHSCRKLADKL